MEHGFALQKYDWVDSTNDTARELFLAKGMANFAVVAEGQKKGRGRLDRVWESPYGKNLYVSLVVAPPAGLAVPLLTLLTGVAVADALKPSLKTAPLLKWPNDVQLAGKKVSGILCEQVFGPLGKAVVIGIGININAGSGDFSPTVRDLATSLFLAEGKSFVKEDILQAVLESFRRWYDIYLREGFSPLKKAYIANSSLYNKQVTVVQPTGEIKGVVVGIDDHGRLLVTTPSGKTERITVGDVLVTE